MVITRNLGASLLGLGMMFGGIFIAANITIPTIIIVVWLVITGAAIFFVK